MKNKPISTNKDITNTSSDEPKRIIPLVYAYIYMKIKKKMRGDRITGSDLRVIIQREILCKRNDSATGGDTKGIPRRHCYDIIKDLVDLGLLERIDRFKYEDKRVVEAAERLKDWDFNDKLKNDKKVMKKLGSMIDIMVEDPVYKVIRSNCDKLLKEVFW